MKKSHNQGRKPGDPPARSMIQRNNNLNFAVGPNRRIEEQSDEEHSCYTSGQDDDFGSFAAIPSEGKELSYQPPHNNFARPGGD